MIKVNNITFNFATILFAAIIAFFNIDNDSEIYSALIKIVGFILFIQNFNQIRPKYSYTILFCILFISLYINFVFIALYILGYLFFIKLLFDQKPILLNWILAVCFLVIIFSHIINNHQTDMLYKLSLFDNSNRQDLFFHSTLASNYKIFGYCTTALHDAPQFEYWDITNILASKLSTRLNIGTFSVYSFILPLLLWTVILKLSTDLILRCTHFDNKNHRYFSFMLLFMVVTAVLCFQAYIGPVQNFLRWDAPKILAVPMGLILILFLIFINTEIIEIKNRFLFIIIGFGLSASVLYLIFYTKFYFSHFIMISLGVLVFYKFKRKLNYLIIINLLNSVFLYIFFTTSFSGMHGTFDIQPFSLLDNVVPDSQFHWLIFSFGFPLLTILCLNWGERSVELNSLFTRNVNNEKIGVIILSILFIFVTLLVTLIGGTNRWNIFYYTDTFYLILIIPLCIALIKYLSTLNLKKLNVNQLILMLFLIFTFLNTFGYGLKSWSNSFSDRSKLIAFQEYDNLEIKDEEQKILNLTQTLEKIRKENKKSSVLWVPKTNTTAWNTINIEYPQLRPFIFTALSEMPLIYGFPPGLKQNNLKDIGFAYQSYSTIESDHNLTISDVLVKAKQMGYNNLYSLVSHSHFTHHKL